MNKKEINGNVECLENTERCGIAPVSDVEAAAYRYQIMKVLPNVKGRDIVIWGTREKGRLMKEIVESLGQRVFCFISSRPRSDTCYGLPLYTQKILDRKKHYIILTTRALEVYSFLQKNGYVGGEKCEDYVRPVSNWHDDLIYDGCMVGRGTYGYETLYEFGLGIFVKKIGRYCSINGSAKFQDSHPMGWVTTSPFLYDEYGSLLPPVWMGQTPIRHLETPKTEIGNDVWIGANVNIIPGVKIGDGAVIGACAFVNRDVEPYAVVGGVPARVLKYRYPKEMIDSFLRIQWWNWSLEKIAENFEAFYDPELFCRTFDPEYRESLNIRSNP